MRRKPVTSALLLGGAIILASGLWYLRQRSPQTSATGGPTKNGVSRGAASQVASSWGIELKDAKGIDVSPHRKLLVLASGAMVSSIREPTSGQIQVWDIEKRTLLHRFRDAEFVATVDISPDLKSIVSSNVTPVVKLWDIAGKRIVKEYKDPDNDQVGSAAFSPNGKWLATRTFGFSQGDAVRLWDVQSGKLIKTIKARNRGSINAARFSPDGNALAIAFGDATELDFGFGEQKADGGPKKEKDRGGIGIYDLTRSGAFQSLGGKNKEIAEIAFSPDGKSLASLDNNGKLQIWDIAGKVLHRSLPQSEAPIAVFYYSDDGRWLATVQEKTSVIKIWSTRSWTVKYNVEIQGQPGPVKFAGDKELLVIGWKDELIKVWHVNLSGMNS